MSMLKLDHNVIYVTRLFIYILYDVNCYCKYVDTALKKHL